jgi:hypothetical protein
MAARARPLDWSDHICFTVGKALLHASAGTLTAPAISAAIGKVNAKRKVDEMVAAGLLEKTVPPPAAGPGRRATTAYRLSDASADELRARIRSEIHPGQLEALQQLVLADARPGQVGDLFAALRDSTALPDAAWYAVLDGEPQMIAIAFAGEDATHRALDLVAELHSRALGVSRTVCSFVGPSHELAAHAHAGRTAPSRLTPPREQLRDARRRRA